MPSGSPLGPTPAGKVIDGTRNTFHILLNNGSPVLARPSGASPGALGASRKSISAKTAANRPDHTVARSTA